MWRNWWVPHKKPCSFLSLTSWALDRFERHFRADETCFICQQEPSTAQILRGRNSYIGCPGDTPSNVLPESPVAPAVMGEQSNSLSSLERPTKKDTRGEGGGGHSCNLIGSMTEYLLRGGCLSCCSGRQIMTKNMTPVPSVPCPPFLPCPRALEFKHNFGVGGSCKIRIDRDY